MFDTITGAAAISRSPQQVLFLRVVYIKSSRNPTDRVRLTVRPCYTCPAGGQPSAVFKAARGSHRLQ